MQFTILVPAVLSPFFKNHCNDILAKYMTKDVQSVDYNFLDYTLDCLLFEFGDYKESAIIDCIESTMQFAIDHSQKYFKQTLLTVQKSINTRFNYRVEVNNGFRSGGKVALKKDILRGVPELQSMKQETKQIFFGISPVNA